MTTSSGEDADQPVGEAGLPQEALDAIAEAAAAVQRTRGTSNGQAALYWHLVAIARSHAKAPGQ